MGRWEATDTHVFDEDGCLKALCADKETAIRIVREHNAFEGLVELVKGLRDKPYGLKSLSKLSEHACDAVIRDTWIPKIDAVLAQAEGRDSGDSA